MSTGKGTKSIRKSQQGNDLLPSVGFVSTVAKHKATLGQTVINLQSLTVPTEATSLGFVQPSGATLAAMDLQRYKNNVVVASTARGYMDNPLDFRVTGSQQITLQTPALENEIFTIKIEAQPKNAINLVAAQPKVQSYTLTAGQTDIPVGPYTVNRNPGEDIGECMVIIDRTPMMRNTDNQAPGSGIEGDYYELTGIIRMNTPDFTNDRRVTLMWVGALVDNPQDSQLAMIQTLGAQIDAMIPTLAALAGVDETDFQAAPNDVDLAAFGADFLAFQSLTDSRLDYLESVPNESLVLTSGNGHGSTNTKIRRFSVIESNNANLCMQITQSATLGDSITILKDGIYSFTYHDTRAAGGGDGYGLSVNSTELTTNLFSLVNTSNIMAIGWTTGANATSAVSVSMFLAAGSVVRAHTNGNLDGNTATLTRLRASCVRRVS